MNERTHRGEYDNARSEWESIAVATTSPPGLNVVRTGLGNAEDHKKILKLPTIIDVFVY
jgi:hypothetical protein